MNEEINVDIEESYKAFNGFKMEIKKPMEYKDEWLTTTCIDASYLELEKCKDEYEKVVSHLKEYLDALDSISSVDPPQIEETDSNDESVNIGIDKPSTGEEESTEPEGPVVIPTTPGKPEGGESPDTPPSEPVHPGPAEEEIIDYAFINMNGIPFIYNLNGQPTEIKLSENTQIILIDGNVDEKGMVKIKLESGEEGYVQADYITMKSDVEAIATANIKTNLDNPVELKLGKGEDCKAIRNINIDEQLEVIGYTDHNKLVKVRTSDGLEGYISADNLIINK